MSKKSNKKKLPKVTKKDRLIYSEEEFLQLEITKPKKKKNKK